PVGMAELSAFRGDAGFYVSPFPAATASDAPDPCRSLVVHRTIGAVGIGATAGLFTFLVGAMVYRLTEASGRADSPTDSTVHSRRNIPIGYMVASMGIGGAAYGWMIARSTRRNCERVDRAPARVGLMEAARAGPNIF